MVDVQGLSRQAYLDRLVLTTYRLQPSIPLGSVLFQTCNDMAFQNPRGSLHSTGFAPFARAFACTSSTLQSIELCRDGAVAYNLVFEPHAQAANRGLWSGVCRDELGTPEQALLYMKQSGLEPLLASQDTVVCHAPWSANKTFSHFCKTSNAFVFEHVHESTNRTGFSLESRTYFASAVHANAIREWAELRGDKVLCVPERNYVLDVKLGPVHVSVPFAPDVRTARDFLHYFREWMLPSRFKQLTESAFEFYDGFAVILDGARLGNDDAFEPLFDRAAAKPVFVELLPEHSRKNPCPKTEDFTRDFLILEKLLRTYTGNKKDSETLCVSYDRESVNRTIANYDFFSTSLAKQHILGFAQYVVQKIDEHERRLVYQPDLQQLSTGRARALLGTGVTTFLQASTIVANATKKFAREMYAAHNARKVCETIK